MHLRTLTSIALVAGCNVHSGGNSDQAFVTATWQLGDLESGDPIACPSGFPVAALVTQPLDDDSGLPSGAATTTQFPCDDGEGTSAPVTPATYDTALVIESSDGAMWATSLHQTLDMHEVDQAFATILYDDAGYFHLTWTLVGAVSGSTLDCGVIPIDGIEVASTSASASADNFFECELGSSYTPAIVAGTYDVAIGAETGGIHDGVYANLANREITTPNQVTELGSVMISIDGQ